MPDVIVQLPLDRTGRAPNNLIGSEEHILKVTPGFPYKIITLEHGGFYINGLRVYDANYNRLEAKKDYIVTYVYKSASESTGLSICGAIVFLDPLRTGKVYTSAQMVGGDLCYSFTVIEDYVAFFKTKPINYVPFWMDYVGNQPVWQPGELAQERWHLDTYQPFNNEIWNMAQNRIGAGGTYEDDYRSQIAKDHDAFLARFTNRLELHIADKANPHSDSKANTLIGLDQLQNYPVANQTDMLAGTSNVLYITPQLTGAAAAEWAIKPLNAHIADKANPHGVTLVQLDALSKQNVNAIADTKYLTTEQVANSDYANVNNANKTYTTLYNEFRNQIPAGNFAAGGTNGYLPLNRYTRGTPAANKVLLADNQSWVDIAEIFALYGNENNSKIFILNFASGVTEKQAYNVAMAQPQVWTASLGSMFLYNLILGQDWGYGNGAFTITQSYTHGCIKTESGWVML